MARHEHYIALKMNIQENSNVLDVGCGIGGPAREICTFTNANITGLNISDYQIERAIHYTSCRGLSDKIKYVKGDYMKMPFEDGSFDAAYDIEATCHSPSLEGVYREVYRVVKPGGVCAFNEWLLTDSYDESNQEHRNILHNIEVGNGVPSVQTRKVARNALQKVGFEILLEDDLCAHRDVVPWYYPLAGQLKYVRTWGDFWQMLAISKLGRFMVNYMVGGLEMIGLAPKGIRHYHAALSTGASALVAAGEKQIFSPMILFICRKPEA